MQLKKRPRVGIIGGVIFGLSCALNLDKTHDVTVFEQGADILGGATYANHNRHHYGFHYPRSDDTARIARERYGLEVFTGTLEKVTYAPDHFDVVTMGDVIEHTANPVKTMLAINKILKPNGLVILSTPNIDGLFPQLSYQVSKIINYRPMCPRGQISPSETLDSGLPAILKALPLTTLT